jgi:uncharacterized protein (DUF1330 family)
MRPVKQYCGLLLLFCVVFGAGYLTPRQESNGFSSPAGRSAFIVGSVNILAPEKLGPYRERATALAKKSGYHVIGSGVVGENAELLEGEWPEGRLVFVEEFASMADLHAFTNAPEMEEIKKLREGLVEVDYMIAINAGENVVKGMEMKKK